MRKTLKALAMEYGAVFVVVYLAIFVLSIVGFWAAFRAGWNPTSAAGTAGTWAAAYVASKVIQPLRIVASIAVTPLVAKAYERSVAVIRARIRTRSSTDSPS